MADFYLDSDVSLRLAASMESAGHTVVAARQLGHAPVTDDPQLLVAVRTGGLLVTHNCHDFALLHDAWQTRPEAFGLSLSVIPAPGAGPGSS